MQKASMSSEMRQLQALMQILAIEARWWILAAESLDNMVGLAANGLSPY